MKLDSHRPEGGPPTPLSPQPWVDAAAAHALSIAVPRILQATKAEDPLCIFLAGSAVYGELCGLRSPRGETLFLSDLDLGIITRDGPGAAVRAGLESALRGIPGPRVLAGFYRRSDLPHTHPTIGLAGAVSRGVALYGDAEHLSAFQCPPPDRVPRGEGARLLSNRVIEWLRSGREDSSPAERVYAAAKLHADAAAVLLVMAVKWGGGGLRERAAAAAALGLPGDLRERIERWTAWRLDPRWEPVPFHRNVDAACADPALEADVVRTVSATIAFSHPGPDADAFFRSLRLPLRDRARAWKRWLRRDPSSRGRGRLSDLRSTPRRILATAAVQCLMGDPEGERTIGRLCPGVAGEDRRNVLGGMLDCIHALDREAID